MLLPLMTVIKFTNKMFFIWILHCVCVSVCVYVDILMILSSYDTDGRIWYITLNDTPVNMYVVIMLKCWGSKYNGLLNRLLLFFFVYYDVAAFLHSMASNKFLAINPFIYRRRYYESYHIKSNIYNFIW